MSTWIIEVENPITISTHAFLINKFTYVKITIKHILHKHIH